MDRLSFVDQVMHRLGTSGLSQLDMQGAILVDPRRAKYRIDARRLAEHMAARLEGIPVLRKRLVQDPMHLGDLRMVDDPDFDVWNHIGFATLPSPGDERTLNRHLAGFSAQTVDLDRPLWRFEIIDGLRDGRIAVAQKLSHATMDGVAAMKVMQTLHDARPVHPSRYRKRVPKAAPLPTRLALLADVARESVDRLAVRGPRFAAALARTALSAGVRRLGGASAGASTPAKKVFAAQRTSLNTAISSDKRNIAFATFDVEGLKALGKSLDCKLNDLCLLMLSEALLEYFKGIGEEIDFDLILGMPINVRQPGTREIGNALAVGLIDLHNTIGPLPLRLRAIQAETRAAKDGSGRKGVAVPSILSQLGDVLPPLLIDLAAWLLKASQPWDKLPLAMNTVMSNVAGPSDPPYLAGMPIDLQIPMPPMFPTSALATAAVSMGGQLTIGFHACGSVVAEENMHLFTDGLHRAQRALTKQAARGTPKPRREIRRARKGRQRGR